MKADLKLQALQHDFNAAGNQPHPVHHCGLPQPVICPARVLPGAFCAQRFLRSGVQPCMHAVEDDLCSYASQEGRRAFLLSGRSMIDSAQMPVYGGMSCELLS